MSSNAPADDAQDYELPSSMFQTGSGSPERATITMYRVSRDPRPEEGAPGAGLVSTQVEFTEIDGLAIFEGDIVLGTVEEVREAAAGVTEAVIITGQQFRWPNGVVPYVAAASVRDKAERAIAHWQQKTPFRFPKRTNQPDYISFEAGSPTTCQSRVGRQGGKQVITLGENCSLGSAIHEIGHALGLWHEQSREDRDTFVTIVRENIKPEALHNFNKHVLDGDDLGQYDYGSIMHYHRKAFSRNDKDTIVPKQAGVEIGQRSGLSPRDIAGIKMAYPTLNWPAGDEAESSAEEAAAPV